MFKEPNSEDAEQNRQLAVSKAVSPHLYVMLNQTKKGTPKFGRPQKIFSDVKASSIDVADLDGDGKSEIVLNCPEDRETWNLVILSTAEKVKYSIVEKKE